MAEFGRPMRRGRSRWRAAGALLLLAGAAAAVEVPTGKMPRIDGIVAPEEWEGAAVLRTPEGVARLMTAGRVLCVGLTLQRPYAGERIDLQVAEATGQNYSWHSFHPGCTVPPQSLLPIAPVIVRRASYSMRADSQMSPSSSCKYRARVYEEAGAWSAEFAVSLESLDVSPRQRIVFRLDVLFPAGEEDRAVAFAPATGSGLDGWQELAATWPLNARRFLTLEEDERRSFELALFRESMARITGRRPPVNPIADAIEGKKSNEAIDRLLARLDGCLKADPSDLFAHATKVQLLLRANRVADAGRAANLLWQRKRARTSWIVSGTRRATLFAQGRFREGLELDLPGRDAPEMRAVLAAWEAEIEARERDASRGDLPRVVFETSKGPVVVELFAHDVPSAVTHLLSLVDNGAFVGVPFEDVTGGVGARVTGKGGRTVVLEEGSRRAWRGSLAFLARSGNAGATLLFTTGHQSLPAVGRVVEGMAALDALEWGDRLASAAVVRKTR